MYTVLKWDVIWYNDLFHEVVTILLSHKKSCSCITHGHLQFLHAIDVGLEFTSSFYKFRTVGPKNHSMVELCQILYTSNCCHNYTTSLPYCLMHTEEGGQNLLLHLILWELQFIYIPINSNLIKYSLFLWFNKI